jgi:hypothetical protein
MQRSEMKGSRSDSPADRQRHKEKSTVPFTAICRIHGDMKKL